MDVKEGMKLFIPPAFINLAKYLLRKKQGHSISERSFIEYEYIPEGWSYAKTHPEVKGWNVQNILDIYKQKWPRFLAMTKGPSPLGINHESALATDTDIYSHNAIITFGYVLAFAAYHKEELSVLDWGGGIGHYYVLAKALLPHLKIDYHCKDVPALAEYGARLFPEQHFYSDESCFKRTYNCVMASTSIHYTEDWKALLANLAKIAQNYVYITGLPIVETAPSFVFVQRPYAYGYNTGYIGWCFNKKEFLDYAETIGLKLVREFIDGNKHVIHGAPEQNEYRGFLFNSKESKRL